MPKDLKELNITIKPRIDLMEIKSLISQIFDIQTSKEAGSVLNFKKLSVLRPVSYTHLTLPTKRIV